MSRFVSTTGGASQQQSFVLVPAQEYHQLVRMYKMMSEMFKGKNIATQQPFGTVKMSLAAQKRSIVEDGNNKTLDKATLKRLVQKGLLARYIADNLDVYNMDAEDLKSLLVHKDKYLGVLKEDAGTSNVQLKSIIGNDATYDRYIKLLLERARQLV